MGVQCTTPQKMMILITNFGFIVSHVVIKFQKCPSRWCFRWLSVLIIFSFNFLWLEILHGIKCIMLLKCWLVPNFTRHCTVFKLKLKNSTKLWGNLFLCFKEKPRFWSFFARVPVRCLLQKHQCTFGSTLNGTKFHMRLQLIAPIRYY